MFKRNTHKLMSLILALMFAVSLVPFAVAAETAAPDFNQVSSWAKPHIQKLFDHRIMSGDQNGNILPKLTSHRWEAAVLTVKAFGFDALSFDDKITGNFTDTQFTDPYVEDYINKAVALGVVNGDGKGGLLLDRELTRVEMFGLAANALAIPDAPNDFVSGFTDTSALDQWELDIICKLEAAGIISGDGDGNVLPREPINREQLCVLFSNILGELIDEDTDYENATHSLATIRKDGVHVRNLTAETLLITQGVGDGDVTLENCEIDTLTVRGGGANSIHLVGSGVRSVLVEAEGVRVSVNNSSTVQQIGISSRNVIVDTDGLIGGITIRAIGAAIRGAGTVGLISVIANNASIEVANSDITVSSGVTGTVVDGVNVEGGTETSTGNGGTNPPPPVVTNAALRANEGITTAKTEATKTAQSYTVSGKLNYVQNVFPDEVAADFINELDGGEGSYRPGADKLGGKFTRLSIENFSALLAQAGFEDGAVFSIVQSNPALAIYEGDNNIAYDEATDMWLKTKQYIYSSGSESAFNLLLANGASDITVQVYTGECTVGDAPSVDNANLVLTLTFRSDIALGGPEDDVAYDVTADGYYKVVLAETTYFVATDGTLAADIGSIGELREGDSILIPATLLLDGEYPEIVKAAVYDEDEHGEILYTPKGNYTNAAPETFSLADGTLTMDRAYAANTAGEINLWNFVTAEVLNAPTIHAPGSGLGPASDRLGEAGSSTFSFVALGKTSVGNNGYENVTVGPYYAITLRENPSSTDYPNDAYITVLYNDSEQMERELDYPASKWTGLFVTDGDAGLYTGTGAADRTYIFHCDNGDFVVLNVVFVDAAA